MSRRLTAAEITEEVEWLLDNGVHPLMICQQMGRSLSSVERAARRVNNRRIVAVFGKYYTQERMRKARAA